jgi:hypothetical protein
MVLVGVVLSRLVDPMWILLSAFVGVNLIQSAFTGFCPATAVFRRMGFTEGGCGPGCGTGGGCSGGGCR